MDLRKRLSRERRALGSISAYTDFSLYCILSALTFSFFLESLWCPGRPQWSRASGSGRRAPRTTAPHTRPPPHSPGGCCSPRAAPESSGEETRDKNTLLTFEYLENLGFLWDGKIERKTGLVVFEKKLASYSNQERYLCLSSYYTMISENFMNMHRLFLILGAE